MRIQLGVNNVKRCKINIIKTGKRVIGSDITSLNFELEPVTNKWSVFFGTKNDRPKFCIQRFLKTSRSHLDEHGNTESAESEVICEEVILLVKTVGQNMQLGQHEASRCHEPVDAKKIVHN